MIWINCRERLPINGQDVWYYGPDIGVWRGRFEIDSTPEAESIRKQLGISTNLFICDEALGVVDTADASYWMPREAGSDRPEKPEVN